MITRRFERADEAGVRRFWEIELDGARSTTRRGRVDGGLVDGKRREFETPDDATNEAELRILERVGDGWQEIAIAQLCPARNFQLEAAIVDAIEDDAAWSVYADWLQARGDRFGEWLGLSIAGALPDTDPQTRQLWSSELTWLAERTAIHAVARLDHRHGFVVRAWVGRTDVEAHNRFLVRLLAALLRSSAATLLRSLTLGRIAIGSQVDALLGDRDSIMLEHLRELMLGDFVYPDQSELSWNEIGDLARVLQACPSLRSLHVRGAAIACEAAIDHPHLTRLTLETGGLAGEVVDTIMSASLPSLHQLELWFGQPEYGATATIDQLAPLLHADALPNLRELGLVDCEFADAIAEALAGSSRLARLERVDLSRGTLRASGGQAILDHADAFRHLRSLDLDGNYLPPALAHALAAALPGVVRIGEQVDPAIGRDGGAPGYYAAVGE